jgi:predicted nucleic acid-binding protein
MNLVVSDASPIHYLVLINAVSILPKLFSKVIIPEHVITTELQSPRTPPRVRTWVSNLPPWVEVRKPAKPQALHLHRGEEHAIALALEFNAPILLDEKEARKVAEDKGLLVIGTVGLIERAAAGNLIDLRESLIALQKTNMRFNRSLIDDALERQAQKRTKPAAPRSPQE